ncbi:MAG: exopolyphosphatase, partial [Anaerolineae bacterium]|nr:exopolyphosphatase [Anaerolineae bacterium]
IAAIDLGSNSFHMIVARPQDAGFHVLDRLREMVRLAGGLDKNDFLSAESMDRGLACLERFGQR